jgi:hypothetical protein
MLKTTRFPERKLADGKSRFTQDGPFHEDTMANEVQASSGFFAEACFFTKVAMISRPTINMR